MNEPREFYVNGDYAVECFTTRIECKGDIHVIEYAAYEELKADYDSCYNDYCEAGLEVNKLEAKLAIAVEAMQSGLKQAREVKEIGICYTLNTALAQIESKDDKE